MVGRNLGELVAMLHEHLRAGAEQVDGRLESGQQDEGRRADDVAVGEDLAVELHLGEGRQEVVFGRATPLVEQPGEVGGELCRR